MHSFPEFSKNVYSCLSSCSLEVLPKSNLTNIMGKEEMKIELVSDNQANIEVGPRLRFYLTDRRGLR